jgi:hypothetical protein
MHRAERIGVAVAQDATASLERPQVETLRLVEPPALLEDISEVVRDPKGVGMIVSERLARGVPDAAEQRLGLVVTTVPDHLGRQVVHRDERVGMSLSKDAETPLDGPPQEDFAFIQAPRVTEDVSQIMVRLESLGMILAEHAATSFQDASMQLLGFGPVRLVGQEVGQGIGADQRVRMLGPEHAAAIGQIPPLERFRLIVTAPAPQHGREVVGRCQGLGMVEAENPAEIGEVPPQ